MEEIFCVIREILTVRLAPAFLDELLLYNYWLELESEYGESGGGALELSEEAWKQILEKMDTNDLFTSWIAQREAQWDYHKLDEKFRIGLLLSTDSFPFSIKLLPERLNKAVEQARVSYSDVYADCKTYLRTQDEIWHNSNNSKSNKNKNKNKKESINAVSEEKTKFPRVKCDCGIVFRQIRDYFDCFVKLVRKNLKVTELQLNKLEISMLLLKRKRIVMKKISKMKMMTKKTWSIVITERLSVQYTLLNKLRLVIHSLLLSYMTQKETKLKSEA
jgi:hypothetical protein